MHNFSQIAAKLLSEYKSLLKKQFSAAESAKKIAQLGLDKRLSHRELELYRLLTKIIKKSCPDERSSQSRLRYSGIDRYVQHIKEVLSNYYIENGVVIHVAQTASRAMIDAIQLVTLPEARLTDAIAKKLDHCAQIIAKYGVEEQQKVFMNSLTTYLERNTDFFLPLMNRYQHYLAEPVTKDNGAATDAEKNITEDIAC